MLSALRTKLTFNNFRQLGAVKVIGYTYASIVTLGGIRGMVSGTGKFIDWHATRKPVTIGNDLYDPVVNTCRDSGIWGLYALQGGFGSAAIVATAPFSVPYLLKNVEEVDDKNDKISENT